MPHRPLARRRRGRPTASIAAACALTAGTLLAAGAVRAAEVSGTLTVPSEPPADAREATGPGGYWEEWNGFLDPRPRGFDPRRELTVVLAGTPSVEPKGCDYAIDGGDLAPRTMVVRPSTPFRIENRSPADHELHAPGVAELAPLQTAPGNARTASIPRPGTYDVRDRLFPHLHGHLVVAEDLVACAEVAADGSYTFADVMPGTYTLRVYRNGEVVAERPTEVATRNLTIDAITPELRARK